MRVHGTIVIPPSPHSAPLFQMVVTLSPNRRLWWAKSLFLVLFFQWAQTIIIDTIEPWWCSVHWATAAVYGDDVATPPLRFFSTISNGLHW